MLRTVTSKRQSATAAKGCTDLAIEVLLLRPPGARRRPHSIRAIHTPREALFARVSQPHCD